MYVQCLQWDNNRERLRLDKFQRDMIIIKLYRTNIPNYKDNKINKDYKNQESKKKEKKNNQESIEVQVHTYIQTQTHGWISV